MKRIWLLALLWGALCLAGAVWAALGLQGDLGRLAREELARQGDVAAGLQVSARGQDLFLSGTTNRQGDMERVAKGMAVHLHLRGPFGAGDRWQPVRRVVNEIAVVPRPEGWGVLAATASAVHLRGVAGSENEANRIGLAVRSSGQLVTKALVNDLAVDGELFIESDQLESTIQSVPALTSEVVKRGLLAVTTWGRKWLELDVTKPAELLRRQVLAEGLPAEAWETDLFAEVERVRDNREDYAARELEKHRLESLAPGHVVMAVRGSQILLRGELGSEQACELLGDAIRVACQDRVVIDELAHSSHRKPEDSPKLLASTVPRLPSGLLAKYLAVGTPDLGWKALDLDALDVENQETLGQAMLPAGLDRRLVLPDVSTGLVWINSIESAPTQRDVTRKPSYFMLAAVGSHVYLRGAVAEEAVRTQVEAAARRLYGSRELDVAVRLDATCLPIGQALQTLSTLPPPPSMDMAGILAFAFNGDEWHVKNMLMRWLEPEELGKSGLVPAGTSMNLLMPDVLAVTPAVKTHLARLSLGPPGIPVQSSSPP